MTQVSINPNTANAIGQDKAVFLRQLKETDPNKYDALNLLIRDLTGRKDPGQSGLESPITPVFSEGREEPKPFKGRDLVADFFFKTPKGMVMNLEDAASMVGIATEFLTMSPSQRFGYQGKKWHDQYTKPAVEMVKQIAPVAFKGYMGYQRGDLQAQAGTVGLGVSLAEGMKEGVHERGAATFIEPFEMAFPVAARTYKALGTKPTETTYKPRTTEDLETHSWEEDPDDINRRVHEVRARKSELHKASEIEHDYALRIKALQDELVKGIGDDAYDPALDAFSLSSVGIQAGLKSGKYEWKGERPFEDILTEELDTFNEWLRTAADLGMPKAREPRFIGEQALDSLRERFPARYADIFKKQDIVKRDTKRHGQLLDELHDLEFAESGFVDVQRKAKLERMILDLEDKIGPLRQEVDEGLQYVDIERRILDYDREIDDLDHAIADTGNQLSVENDPDRLNSLTEEEMTLTADRNALEIEREKLIIERDSNPLAQQELLSLYNQYTNNYPGPRDKADMMDLERAINLGFIIPAAHATKGDIKFFDPGRRGEAGGGSDAYRAWFFTTPSSYPTLESYWRTSNLAKDASVPMYDYNDPGVYGRKDLIDYRRKIEEEELYYTEAKEPRHELKKEVESAIGIAGSKTAYRAGLTDIFNFIEDPYRHSYRYPSKSAEALGLPVIPYMYPKFSDDVRRPIYAFIEGVTMANRRDPTKSGVHQKGLMKKTGVSWEEIKSRDYHFTSKSDDHPVGNYDYSFWFGDKEYEVPENVIKSLEAVDFLGYDSFPMLMRDLKNTPKKDWHSTFDFDPVRPKAVPSPRDQKNFLELASLFERDKSQTTGDISVWSGDKYGPDRWYDEDGLGRDYEFLPEARDWGDEEGKQFFIESDPQYRPGVVRRLSMVKSNLYPAPGTKRKNNFINRDANITPENIVKNLDAYASAIANDDLLEMSAESSAMRDVQRRDFRTSSLIKGIAREDQIIDDDWADVLSVRLAADNYKANREALHAAEGALNKNETVFIEKANSLGGREHIIKEVMDSWSSLDEVQKKHFAEILSSRVKAGNDLNIGDMFTESLGDYEWNRANTSTRETFVKVARELLVREGVDTKSADELIRRIEASGDIVNAIKDAKKFLTEWGGSNTVPVRLKMDNPYMIDREGKYYSASHYNSAMDYAMANGYDGLVVRNVNDGTGQEVTTVYIVWDETKVRSTNAMYDPLDAPIPMAATKEYTDRLKDLKLIHSKKEVEVTKAVRELQEARSHGGHAWPEQTTAVAKMEEKLKGLEIESAETYYDVLEMEQLARGRSPEATAIYMDKLRKNIQEGDELRGLVYDAQLAGDDPKGSSTLKDLQKRIQENKEEYEVILNDTEGLPSKDLLAGVAPYVIPIGLGSSVQAFLADKAEAEEELRTELIPEEELTADVGNLLDTFDIPGLDSPEAKENFILRNSDWAYRISKKDQKRKKDLQKIHLWRKSQLGGNDF